MKTRSLSAYEVNQLRKHNIPLAEALKLPDMPIEYLTGYAEFMERQFVVNQATLIPRLETEELIFRVLMYLQQIKNKYAKITIADIGTGSGAIGITLFLELLKLGHETQVYLSDISQTALKVASENKARLIPPAFDRHIKIIESDLLNNYSDHEDLQIIVANLPYIPTSRIDGLDKSVRDYEPITALDSMDELGVGLINRLIAQCEVRIFRPLAIFLEVDEFLQAKDLLVNNYHPKFFNDNFNKLRFVELKQK